MEYPLITKRLKKKNLPLSQRKLTDPILTKWWKWTSPVTGRADAATSRWERTTTLFTECSCWNVWPGSTPKATVQQSPTRLAARCKNVNMKDLFFFKAQRLYKRWKKTKEAWSGNTSHDPRLDLTQGKDYKRQRDSWWRLNGEWVWVVMRYKCWPSWIWLLQRV